ncbi:nitrogen fixation protein NifR [Staphylococcus borealis]|nr:nitrogen fixation protein NifR [Staphylococcus borealis]
MRRRLNQAFLSSSHPCGRGPNKENFTKKFYKQSKLGVGAPAKRISSRNSTNKASWEWTTNFKKILSHSHSYD